MKHKLDLEATLDRSLRKQVTARRLDGRFDASVWARIEAEEVRATNPMRPVGASSRWLFYTNAIGVCVAAILVVVFGSQAFSGVSVEVPTPELSAAMTQQIVKIAVWTVTIASLAFGLMFTSLGRRLRRELS